MQSAGETQVSRTAGTAHGPLALEWTLGRGPVPRALTLRDPGAWGPSTSTCHSPPSSRTNERHTFLCRFWPRFCCPHPPLQNFLIIAKLCAHSTLTPRPCPCPRPHPWKPPLTSCVCGSDSPGTASKGGPSGVPLPNQPHRTPRPLGVAGSCEHLRRPDLGVREVGTARALRLVGCTGRGWGRASSHRRPRAGCAPSQCLGVHPVTPRLCVEDCAPPRARHEAGRSTHAFGRTDT